jgi:hypothetical protein
MTNSTSRAIAANGTLVQYIEVWNADADGQSMSLESHTRLRGSLVDSETSGRRIRSGEGIAGMALHQRHAIILQESPSDLLQRIGSKNGMELAALIAYPIMKGQEVLSVIVFGIGSGPGAFEVWSRDDRDELSISSSYYLGLKSFEFISRHVKFPKGAGLPGAVWKTGQPKLAQDLAHSAGFMRSFEADETVLNTGLGLPVGSSAGNSESILLLLSSNARPIAVGFEIWQPQAFLNAATEAPNLSRTAADWNAVTSSSVPRTDAIIAETWTSGLPVFTTDLSSSRSSLEAIDGEHLVRALLAIPVYRSVEKAAVVLFGF